MEVAVSQDHTTELQPGQHLKKKKSEWITNLNVRPKPKGKSSSWKKTQGFGKDFLDMTPKA